MPRRTSPNPAPPRSDARTAGPDTVCGRCQRLLDPEDRYCRHCGHPQRETAGYIPDLHQTIVETVPVGIFITDPECRVRYWNRMMEEHTGLKRRQALGRVLFEVVPQLQPFNHRIARVVDTALPLRLDQVTHAAAQQSELTEAFWFGPVLLEDESVALLGAMEDITQKVRVDNQLIRSERLAAIGELAAGVAHNFNNILAAIGGDAQLLELLAQDEKLPPHVAEAARQIHDETMRGGRIAHDLLSFARGAEPQIQRLDMREVVQDAVRLIKNHPAARSVTIEVAVDPGLPPVEADANQLHQVFFNLMLNALQAMPQGGALTISTGLRAHERDPEVGMVDVKFHDTGAGIPREKLRRIFDPFYSNRANGTAGSGLGLPVSLAMVKSIGGDIQVTSAEGIGTTVTVSLPIVERRSAARGEIGRRKQGRALVVDEDANVRRTLTTLLSRYAFEVVTATSGEEGLAAFGEALAEAPFTVVLTEVALARGDALALTRCVREQCPETPVVLLTGATDPAPVLQALEAGADFAFSKPPNFSALLGVVEQLAAANNAGCPQAGEPYGFDDAADVAGAAPAAES
jgi:PAS domain S-box-containing protein